MMPYVIMGAVIVALFFAIIIKDSYDYKKYTSKITKELEETFGTVSTKRFSADEMSDIKKLFYRHMDDSAVDDITASDLDIDLIFERFDNCVSQPGNDVFYSMLRTVQSKDILALREAKIKLMDEDVALRSKLYGSFAKIGRMRKVSIFDCLDYFDELNNRNLMKDYVAVLLVFLSVIVTFFDAAIGVVAIITALCANILTYYKARGSIENYIFAFGYIANFINSAKTIEKLLPDEFSDEKNEMQVSINKLKKYEKYSSIVIGKNSGAVGAGNPLDIVADYLRMLFHVDIIRFYKMLDIMKGEKESIERLYYSLGLIEAYINIASMRRSLDSWCIPKESDGVYAKGIYHPLLDDPVKNDISAKNCVLITGSNASGKSTFLKTVAINVILSKTINTALADEFSCDEYYVFSSMSLKDSITEHDSYFMVEIKALKRVFDNLKLYPDRKILCFVDEVLRGTNTVERIAACTEILKALSKQGVLCFAATHDIELTDILEGIYTNYHFDEDIVNDDILFNYELKSGKASSRNAIKLLSLMGFDDSIVDEAFVNVKDFEKTGVWRKA